jgi:hypothetical protein
MGLFPSSPFAFFLTLTGSESVSLHFMTKWRSQAAQGDERKRPKDAFFKNRVTQE